MNVNDFDFQIPSFHRASRLSVADHFTLSMSRWWQIILQLAFLQLLNILDVDSKVCPTNAADDRQMAKKIKKFARKEIDRIKSFQNFADSLYDLLKVDAEAYLSALRKKHKFADLTISPKDDGSFQNVLGMSTHQVEYLDNLDPKTNFTSFQRVIEKVEAARYKMYTSEKCKTAVQNFQRIYKNNSRLLDQFRELAYDNMMRGNTTVFFKLLSTQNSPRYKIAVHFVVSLEFLLVRAAALKLEIAAIQKPVNSTDYTNIFERIEARLLFDANSFYRLCMTAALTAFATKDLKTSRVTTRDSRGCKAGNVKAISSWLKNESYADGQAAIDFGDTSTVILWKRSESNRKIKDKLLLNHSLLKDLLALVKGTADSKHVNIVNFPASGELRYSFIILN